MKKEKKSSRKLARAKKPRDLSERKAVKGGLNFAMKKPLIPAV
jgi:hypothetical protein